MIKTFHLATTSTTKVSGDNRPSRMWIVRGGCGRRPEVRGHDENVVSLRVERQGARPPFRRNTFGDAELVGDSSFTTVSTPSPQEANASPVSG